MKNLLQLTAVLVLAGTLSVQAIQTHVETGVTGDAHVAKQGTIDPQQAAAHKARQTDMKHRTEAAQKQAEVDAFKAKEAALYKTGGSTSGVAAH